MTIERCKRVLFSMLKFFKKSIKTSVAAKNVPLIRHLGFAERERETFAKLIFHLSFLIKLGELLNTLIIANTP